MRDGKRTDYLKKVRHHDRTEWSEGLPQDWFTNDRPVGLYDQSIGPPKDLPLPLALSTTAVDANDSQAGPFLTATTFVCQNLEDDPQKKKEEDGNPTGSSSPSTTPISQKRPSSQEASQQKKKKKKTNEKRATTSKPIYNSSGRKARHAVSKEMGDPTSSASSVVAVRREQDTTYLKDTMEKTFSVVSLEPGTLYSTLYRGLEGQMEASTSEEVQATYQSMKRMMIDLVKANSDSIWSAVAVLQDYALSTFKSNPTLGDVDIKKRREALGPIFTSQIFVYHLIRALWRWNDLTDATLAQVKLDGTQRLAFEAVLAFKKKHENQQPGGTPIPNFDPFVQRPEKVVSAKFLEACARSVHDMICSHVLRNVSELKQRVSD